jgi:hypothetical protein
MPKRSERWHRRIDTDQKRRLEAANQHGRRVPPAGRGWILSILQINRPYPLHILLNWNKAHRGYISFLELSSVDFVICFIEMVVGQQSGARLMESTKVVGMDAARNRTSMNRVPDGQ